MPSPRILVIDDNANDFLLLCEASREIGFAATHEQVSHGHEVMPRLDAHGSGPERPAMILLDINLPRITGQEVLRSLKSHPVHQSIPVMMYSSCSRKQDEQDALAQGAIGFLEKPRTFDDYLPLATMLRDLIAYRSADGGPPRDASSR